jgi:hypothetical protein
MNYKLDYITRILQKTSKKRIENYVISRIWHQLNNDEIKISHQQYVNRGDGKYALTDLYFPQLNYHIEVNEEFHYKDDHKINLDKLREDDIKRKTNGHIVRFIDCQGSLETIHSQIDDIVKEINSLIETQKGLSAFRPWHENELHPEYWIERGSIDVEENINLRTIEDIGVLFNVAIKNRGFLKPGAVEYSRDGFSQIWWPEKKDKNSWKNDFHNDFEYISEQNVDPIKAKNHLNHFINNNVECTRIVFFKHKDELGFKLYKFVGCYKLNVDKSVQANQVIWERFAKNYKLSTQN